MKSGTGIHRSESSTAGPPVPSSPDASPGSPGQDVPSGGHLSDLKTPWMLSSGPLPGRATPRMLSSGPLPDRETVKSPYFNVIFIYWHHSAPG